MKTFTVSLEQASARAKLHHVNVNASGNRASIYTLLAYDIVTDIYPEAYARLVGPPASAYRAHAWDFEIH